MDRKIGIATNPDQVKRLLACGVDPNTADMYLSINMCPGENYGKYSTRVLGEDLITLPEILRSIDYEPAWSLSALLELLPTPIYTEHHKQYALRIIRTHDHKAWIFDYESFDTSLYQTNGTTAIEACVRMIERLAANGYTLNEY